MKLDRIEIKNFRSIKNETIKFDHNCKILLGKNEAGKSNVLKSIAAVFDRYPVSTRDRRKRIDNEKIDDYFVRAVMKLDSNDFKNLEYKLYEISNIDTISFTNGKSVSDYIKSNFEEFLIEVDIKNDGQPYYSYWKIDESNWKFSNKVPKGSALINQAGEILKLDVKLFELVEELYEKQPINCNYWEYKKDFLLPNSVTISKFIADPSSEKALSNIFTLCNRGDIKQEFEDAQKEDGDYINLLEQVSKATTKVFQGIWKDFKKTSLELIPNGKDEILIKVVNKAKYSFEDRSDGFKKFISILLMLSTRSRSNKLNSFDLILIDEPDQSLYPTSVRYLRDELLKIAEKSYVIYSTHSQYMIDSNCIDRHLIVEKTDDITTLQTQDSNAPFSNDELLRNAIGSSIFECLKDVNIVFEGWLDKQLFDKYCAYNKEKSFEQYGTVFLRGISGLDALIQLLILADKRFLIVADSDKASKAKLGDFQKTYPEYKSNWLSYGDIDSKFITMEDFLSPSHITSIIKKNGAPNFSYDTTKNAIQNIERVFQNKEEKQKIKNELITKLTKTKIDSDYSKFIVELKNKLMELK